VKNYTSLIYSLQWHMTNNQELLITWAGKVFTVWKMQW